MITVLLGVDLFSIPMRIEVDQLSITTELSFFLLCLWALNAEYSNSRERASVVRTLSWIRTE
jgi:hypothetical protein